MKPNSFPWWVWVSIIATAVLSVIAASPRIKAEESNKAFGLAVEYSTVQEMSGPGTTPEEVLSKLAAAGANVLVISEETVGELVLNGELSLHRIDRDRVTVSGREVTVRRVAEALDAINPATLAGPYFGGDSVDVRMDPASLRGTSVGFNVDSAKIGRDLGMEIVVRTGNRPPQAAWLVAQAKQLKAIGLLPLGDSILGFKGKTDEVGELLAANGMAYVSPEFTNLAGDQSFKAKFPNNVIRLHTAQSAELVRMDSSAAVERFSKAFRERGMRILLLRPANPAGTADDFASFLTSVKQGAVHEGGTLKTPRAFVLFEGSTIFAVLIGLAMVPAVMWMVSSLITWRPLLIGGVLAALMVLATVPASTRQVTALLGSIGYVVLAYQWLRMNREKPLITQYCGVSLVSLVGGLQVSGLIVGTKYMIQAGQFLGVKASVFVPIIIVGLLFLNDAVGLKSLKEKPILWGTAVASVIALAALLFMNSRTGNDNPAGVSGTELAFRNLLDQILIVRPRTKEFMIGHPALVIGLGLWGASRKSDRFVPLGMAFLAISVIGQTSVVNTMCHLHTPYLLSLTRILVGHIAGGMIGVLGWLTFRALWGRAAAGGMN